MTAGTRGAAIVGTFAFLFTGNVYFTGNVFAQDAAPVEFGNGMTNGFPESVTSTGDGTLYSGSFTGGMVNRAGPGAASAEVWIDKPAEGPGSLIGVLADEPGDILWACYADVAVFQGGDAMPSILRAYDLSSGEEKGSYTFPEGSFCNDIATTADGTAYAADTMGSRIIRIMPGSMEAEVWFADPHLAGADGLSFGPDGALYINSVTTNKLFRLDMTAEGAPGELTELTVSQPLQGPDGMRFGPDGTLYLAENGAGRVVAVTIEGDTATIREIRGGFNAPTAVTLVGDTLWVAEAKLGMMGGQEDPGAFFIHPVAVIGTDATEATAAGNSGGYDSLLTSLGALSTLDVSDIGSGEIRLVMLSEMGEATAEQQAQLQEALTASQSALDAVRGTLAGSEGASAAISQLGLSVDHVLSVEISENGTLVIYVDDTNRS